ncbi:MAG: ParB/RepB/Spo0J family partition protein [Planctomycetes bacterium]|nr:ParB/RepB/Spo0J family partition protein [Planctomycetota bacterium]
MTTPPEDPTRVLELHTDDVIAAPGNRPVSPDSVSDILPSMQAFGQQVPGIVYLAPDGKYICGAGHRRLLCCRILGMRFKAILASGPMSEVELIRLRLTENVIRKAMTPREIAADIEQYITLAKVTQAEAAEHFGFSTSKVSKMLSLKNLAPEIHPLVDSGKLCGDVARIIASLQVGQQKNLADRAVANGWKRDTVEREAKKLRGEKPKVKERCKLEKNGVRLEFEGGLTWELLKTFTAFLTKVVTERSKSEESPANTLPGVFKSA